MRRRRDLDRDADMFFGELRRRATLDVSKLSTWMHALLRYYRLEAAVLAGRERRGHGDCAVVKRRRLKPNRTTYFVCTCFRITTQLYRVQERWQLAEGAET